MATQPSQHSPPSPAPENAPEKADVAEACGCPLDRLSAHFGIRQRNKALRPGQILDAAQEAFSQNGYSDTRLEDIARRAKISKALIYVYYPTKIDLFLAVAQRLIAPLKTSDAAFVLDANRSAEAQFFEMHSVFYSSLARDPHALNVFRLMIAESGRVPEIAEFYTLNFIQGKKPMIQALIRHGVARGEFSRDSIENLDQIEEILGAPAVMLMLVQIITNRMDVYDVERWRALHWRMIMSLLKA